MTNNKAFSLVEMIIVIAIMAVLVGVLAPMFVKYVERSRESVDVQNMDSAYRIASAVYVNDPYAHGTYYYFFDGNDIRNDTVPRAYGKGASSDQHTRYSNPCCELGQYDSSMDYTNSYLAVIFPDPGSGDTVIHIHWTH